MPPEEAEPSNPSDRTADDGASAGDGTEAPETERSEDQPSTAGVSRSQQLSTGPVLEWTEVDPGFDDLFALESVGDGRVMARVWTEGDTQGLFGQRFVISSDGVDWTEVPMPEGLFGEHVSLSAGRWVVTGRYPDVDRRDVGADRVFFSDDQGSTWTEVMIDLPSDPVSPFVAKTWRASPVLVSGERMVLVLSGYSTLDGQALLEDLGRLPAGQRVVSTIPTPDGVFITLVDSDDPHPYALFGSLSSHLAGVYGHDDEEEFAELTDVELAYDEVGVTEAEMLDLLAPNSDPSIRILAGDGSTTEVVASYEGWILSGAATDEGFVVTSLGDSGEAVLRSPDGLAWSEDPSLDPAFFRDIVSADATIWGIRRQTGGSFGIQRGDIGEAPATLATFDGLKYPGELAVGPAGLVVVAERDLSRSLRTDRGLPEEGRVARDGYELRYNEAERSLTLWDLAGDTAIYAFGPAEMQSATLPDGVRVIDDGETAAVVFEDPETGADLVTFTEEDMASLVGMTAAELRDPSSGDPQWPDLWVGWSAEGTDWGWQSLADAFGIHRATIWPEFAVGHDFVIARVAAFQHPDPADPTDDGQVLPTRWFLARVP